MTFLKEIYSEPAGLFEKVEFKKGINIIYGKQVNGSGGKPSLNSIGKSTLIQLLNFCLLSEFNKDHKLFRAKEFMDGYKIVLKLEIGNDFYIIKRSTNNSNKAIFYKAGDKEEEYNLDDLRRILYKKMFLDKKYPGISEDSWFRSIIPLIIRDEKTGFDNPIEYIKEVRRITSTKFHLMMMGIDNTLSERNLHFMQEIKKKDDELKGVSKILEEQYGPIESINNQLDKLGKEISDAQKSKNFFELEKGYQIEEGNADELTKQIKSIMLNNNHLRNLLFNYQDSYNLNVDIDTDKVSEIYQELNEELGIKLKKTLDQAVEFKDKLVESRKNFIKAKIDEIQESIKENNKKINELDIKRSKIFSFLENKKAIKDLSGLFDIISEKTKEYNDLNGKISLLSDINKSYLNKKTEYAKLLEEINTFINKIKPGISSIREIYNEIYSQLYSSEEKEGFFDIVFDKAKQAKIYIIASSRDADGFGKNRGCILVYDLSLLFNIIKNNFIYPRFWVHDGVFNGIYKNQFVLTMNLLNQKAATSDFQYITTLNEDEEMVSEKFGKLDFDLKECIIATYTNKTEGKIFKREY